MQLLPPADLLLINRYLKDNYGSTGDEANFRLVWSDDQFEKRLVDYVAGIHLTVPEVREVRKYNYIQQKYVLEKLTVIHQSTELLTQLSYEPIWTFETNNHEYIMPNYGACKFVVDSLLEAMRINKYYTRYKEPNSTSEEFKEAERARLDALKEELFGNESDITDALSVGEGVAFGQSSSPHSTTPMHKKDVN